MRQFVVSLGLTVLCILSGVITGAAGTLDEVQKRGFLQCGVSTGVPGFSYPDDKGNWSGLDADFCRAVAAAVLHDAAKVKFIPLTARESFTALQSGEVDVLSRNTTWTMTRDTALGLHFAGVSYYDGQGFMVPEQLGVTSALELNNVSVCVQSGTTAEDNVADFFRKGGMRYRPVLFATSMETVKAFEAGRCDVLSSGQAQLYGLRTSLSRPGEALVLPETISREPLGPVVRQGDDAWLNVVRWSLAAMLNAEILGVSSTNVKTMSGTADPEIRRLLGLEGIKGEGLGLDDSWARRIIEQVGNYGEVFDRNLGMGSGLGLQRGLNALWTDGGIHYPPPVR